jgi:putative phage-type endonuclease
MMIQQGSEEWFASRMGKVTASRVKDVMAKTKSGPAATRKNYLMELLCQRLTGNREEGYTNAAMQRGIDLEPIARSAYEIDTGLMVDEVGLIEHPTIEMFGASPDGLVEADGMLEIKCPNTAQHVACIRTGEPDNKYWIQMQTQMACSGREWCDFVSFDDRLPEELQYFRSRVMRDKDVISEIEDDVLQFLGELDSLESEMKERIGK